MANYQDIETCGDEIAEAAKTLAQWHQSQQSPHSALSSTNLDEVPEHVRLAQARLSSNTTKMQLMLDQPSDLIQRLSLYVCVTLISIEA